MRSKDGTAGGEARWQARCPVAVHQSVRECRETLGPPVKSTEPKTPLTSTQRKLRSEPGTHEVGVHVYRSGGRSRSDASRVLLSGRSQGLLDQQGASQKEARKSRLTGDTSREKAKRYADKRTQLKQYALVRLVGFGSHALDTTEDVLGPSPGLPSRVSRREVLRLEGESQPCPPSPKGNAVQRRTAHRAAQRPVGCAFG